jgi:triosephosphate isomerase (TIM)
VGENLAEREAGKIFEVLRAQCEPLFNLSPQMPPGFIVAYEPVWAIGTGKTASSAQAEEVHAFLRQLFGQIWGGENARKLPLLYGGSVKPQNSAELLACSNIDGVLVGGASLDPLSFFEIAANAIQC